MTTPCLALSRPRPRLLPSVALNACAVGTIYLVQTIAASSSHVIGSSVVASLMPGATLAGYAIGVCYCAFITKNLMSAHEFVIHVGWLVASLVLAALAPTILTAAIAYMCVGIGCAMTQRLLAFAGNTASDQARPRAIAMMIAGGLGGIVAARAGAPETLAALGPQLVLTIDAGLIAAAGSLAAIGFADFGSARPASLDAEMAAWTAWCRFPVLRHAALQLAAVFACYNFAWISFIRQDAGATAALTFGAIAGLGATAAWLSGGWCTRATAPRVACWGMGAVALAGLLVPVLWTAAPGRIVVMALVDAGTQTALVASQAGAQALGSCPAMRGRIAALVTTVGFIGGAVGSSLCGLLS